jgi:hypothetical protein
VDEESPILVLVGIGAVLIPDAGIAESRAIGSTDALLRRSYVRAVFALIEGLNYARLLVSTDSQHLADPAREQAALAVRLEKRALNDSDDGRIPSSTRKSFAAFAAAHGVSNPLSPSGDDWQAFRDAVEVRDRITHPRSAAHCRVSDDDFALVQRVHHWYQNLDQRVLTEAREHAAHGA